MAWSGVAARGERTLWRVMRLGSETVCVTGIVCVIPDRRQKPERVAACSGSDGGLLARAQCWSSDAAR